MELATVKLADLNPAKYNPRKDLTPADPEYQHIKNSIEDFGYIDPIIVNIRNNVIVGGHQRYKILNELGYVYVECVYVDFDEAEEKACNAALNKAQGDWDNEALAELLKELNEMDVDMEAYGFDMSIYEEVAEVEEDDYDADESTEAEPKAKQGDIYQLGIHRLMCGDSTDFEDIQSLLEGERATLFLSDPPYGIDAVHVDRVGGGGELKFKGKVGGGCLVKSKEYMPIKGDDSTDTARLNYEIVKELTDNQIIFGGNYFTDFLTPKACWLVWDKEINGNFADVELAWTSFDKAAKLYRWLWNGLCRKGDRSVEGKKRVHPTQKPVGLMGEILKDFTADGDTVLDCFGGSGSTLIACEQLNRKCYMMEFEPRYIDLIIDRWEKFTGKKAVLIQRSEAA